MKCKRSGSIAVLKFNKTERTVIRRVTYRLADQLSELLGRPVTTTIM